MSEISDDLIEDAFLSDAEAAEYSMELALPPSPPRPQIAQPHQQRAAVEASSVAECGSVATQRAAPRAPASQSAQLSHHSQSQGLDAYASYLAAGQAYVDTLAQRGAEHPHTQSQAAPASPDGAGSPAIIEDLGAELLLEGAAAEASPRAEPLPPAKRRLPLDSAADAAAAPRSLRFRPLTGHDDAMLDPLELAERPRAAPSLAAAGGGTAARNQGPWRPRERPYRSLDAVQMLEGSSVSVSDDTGECVYCRTRPLGVPPSWYRPPSGRSSLGTHLLGTPIDTLLRELDDAEFQRHRAQIRAAMDTADADDVMDDSDERAAAPPPPTVGTKLWVDAYAPRTYLQLLSLEGVNAAVLAWLRGWHSTVFGDDRPVDPRLAQLRKVQKADQRPEHKALLLAGAPGIGKTTLAHIAARHCGYRPVEINASDERTGPALRKAIAAAVQMQSVLGEKRPNCLVIDEIDGAANGDEGRGGSAAIRALTQIITSGEVAAEGGDGGGAGAADADEGDAPPGGFRRKGGRKARKVPLMRPIICICNDLYAPVLRPLRAVAQVIVMQPPPPQVLTARLKHVCRKERVAVNDRAVSMLVTKTHGDVRSCLNTLQVLSRQHGRVDPTHISAASIGEKDMSSGPFQVWERLLFTRGARQAGAGGGAAPEDGTDARLSWLAAFGEHELLMKGLHENMLALPYLDMDLRHTVEMYGWLGHFDVWSRRIHQHQQFELYAALPAAILGLVSHCRGAAKSRLVWPSSLSQCAKLRATHEQLLHEWVGSLPGPLASGTLMQDAALLTVPALQLALAPSPSALEGLLLGHKANAVADRVVELMLDYRITYDMDAAAASAVVLPVPSFSRSAGGAGGGDAQPASAGTALKPALHTLHSYRCMAEPPPRNQLNEAIRTMVVYRRQRQDLARSTPVATPSSHRPLGSSAGGAGPSTERAAPGGAGAGPDALSSPPEAPRGEESVRGSAGSMAAALKTASTRVAKAAGGGAKGNWLTKLGEHHGRQKIKRAPLVVAAGAAAGGQVNYGAGVTMSQTSGKMHFPVLYKFNEGYTNAVKRPLVMADVSRVGGPSRPK